jgi:hypothetical protein
VTTSSPALAVIEGSLCQLTRTGARRVGHTPLATAVVEFHPGDLCYFVREHTFGLLPGLPNLYCLDAGFRLLWMAEWPDASDPCAAIVGLEGDTLVTTSAAGTSVRLSAATGRLVGVAPALAAAS